ncbi:MAG: hypothetical protein QOH13_1355 [Thermoleophilaceae bacterium]|nr:hypothetical protein [Thermoleophilaceae bacterium]
MNGFKSKARALTATAAVLALGAVAAPAANAGLLVKTAQGCDDAALTKPFAQFGDNNNYVPIPGGSFEAGSPAWTLTGGAKVVSGNESFDVRSGTDSKSLYLPQGATATSPSICVGLENPSMRWFAKQSGSLLGLGLTGAMTVEVQFETSLGVVVSAPIGAGLLSNSWQPSIPGIVVANLLPLLPGQKTAVAFRFRAVTSNWNVDDAYVDPNSRW